MKRFVKSWGCALCLCAAFGSTSCREAPKRVGTGTSPRPRLDVVQALREDLEAVRHPSDGGGEAWIVEEESSGMEIQAGSPGHWTVVYRAGPRGISEGGWIFFQAPPFWGWSTPQAVSAEVPGFSRVSTTAEGVQLEAQTVDEGLLAVQIMGHALDSGEEVRLEYGAGEVGAFADRFAESETSFYVAVDGDGDGVRKLVPGRLTIKVLAGPAAQLIVLLPSTARPGETVTLTLAFLDAAGSAGVEIEGEVQLRAAGLDRLAPVVEMRAEQRGIVHLEVPIEAVGVFRVEATGPGGLSAESNPIVVSSEGEAVVWGDLHGHSGLSDGTGTFEDYFRYARDVAALDVVALTDHDHWGMEPLALNPRFWEEIRRQVESFYRPGRFVTLLGYEWTSWIHGHRHVLYFDSEGEVLSSVDPAFESPEQLWKALRGKPALTVAHHSAGGPIPTNWQFPPDPELEPVTEIVSVHGSSEAMDSPGLIYSPVPGNFVRDVLDKGYTLGFVGSGDSHDGHPGLAHLASASGGLAAFVASDLTREGILAALRGRRVYATNGPRIVLQTRLAGHLMGADVGLDEEAGGSVLDSALELEVRVVAPDPLERVDVIRSGRVEESVDCEGGRECSFVKLYGDLQAHEYLYLRAVQVNGGAAWSSPYYLH